MIVCDNLKAAVTNPDRYDPGGNRSYQDMARHYGATVMPARPYKPRDKAKVEQSVLLVERWVSARLQRFKSASEAARRPATAADRPSIALRVLTTKPACLGFVRCDEVVVRPRVHSACTRSGNPLIVGDNRLHPSWERKSTISSL